MIYHDLEESFCCENCGHSFKLYYMSVNVEGMCVFCDSTDEYDDDYYEDDSDSPWNEG